MSVEILPYLVVAAVALLVLRRFGVDLSSLLGGLLKRPSTTPTPAAGTRPSVSPGSDPIAALVAEELARQQAEAAAALAERVRATIRDAVRKPSPADTTEDGTPQ